MYRRQPPRVLLLTPPLVQFNTPYAATPLLTAFLRREGIPAVQADLSLELALRLFSRTGIRAVARKARAARSHPSPSVTWFLDHADRYAATVDRVVRYLQRDNPADARWIAGGALPAGPRFRLVHDLAAAGHDPAATDPAGYPRLLASLYIDDLADAIRDGIDSRFALSRYAEHLAAPHASLSPLLRALARATLVDRILDDLTLRSLRKNRPNVVGITIPFPGNVYAAFRIARRVKAWNPRVTVVAGGGFVNTEWRSLDDPRVFDVFDFLTYDDGEVPFLRIVRHAADDLPAADLVRTRYRRDGRVVVALGEAAPLRHRDRPAPCYDGLPLARYCPVMETPNPMARLWTSRRWMKLALAHGCYWHRCAFCDTSLDYIRRFDPADPDTIVGWIEHVRRETGETGFHFVDEAAPPALLRGVSERLIRRGLGITWWTNIRFEQTFTPELAALLARSGCVALTGGLECAERRLLTRMDKGVTPAGAARVMRALAGAGILVHAYLMYGFPGQTAQETVDALETVRQLFTAGCLHSAYWHRFALTVHSPIHQSPRRFGVRIRQNPGSAFTENEAQFTDGGRTDLTAVGRALHKAVFNYALGIGLDEDVRAWFDRRVPRPRLIPTAVARWIR